MRRVFQRFWYILRRVFPSWTKSSICGCRMLAGASRQGLVATSEFVQELGSKSSAVWCFHGSFEGASVYALEESKAELEESKSELPAFHLERFFARNQFSIDQAFLLMGLVNLGSVFCKYSPSLELFALLCLAVMAVFCASMLGLTIFQPSTYVANRYRIHSVVASGECSKNVHVRWTSFLVTSTILHRDLYED